MEMRRIIISLWDDRRIIVYPEGGLEVEVLVNGIGWVISSEAIADAELADMLRQAARLTLASCGKVAPADYTPA